LEEEDDDDDDDDDDSNTLPSSLPHHHHHHPSKDYPAATQCWASCRSPQAGTVLAGHCDCSNDERM